MPINSRFDININFWEKKTFYNVISVDLKNI